MLTFLIADDHPIIRSGIRQILLDEFPHAKIGEAVDSPSMIEKALNGDWDIIISDISMPGGGGLDALNQVLSKKPEQKILILSIYLAEQYALRSLKAGARGFLNKDIAPEELTHAVKVILAGGRYIPPGIDEIGNNT